MIKKNPKYTLTNKTGSGVDARPPARRLRLAVVSDVYLYKCASVCVRVVPVGRGLMCCTHLRYIVYYIRPRTLYVYNIIL